MDEDATLRFIKAVEKCPLLYARKTPHFNCMASKAASWEEVGRTFGLTGSAAKSKFTSIREKYVREKKKDISNWIFFQPMAFTNQYIKNRQYTTRRITKLKYQSSSSLESINELDETDTGSLPVFDESLTNQSRIIEAVKRHPILYKRFGRKYPRKRQLLWKEVGKQCKLDADVIQSAFKNLRRKYGIERKITNGSSWKYFDQLSYLNEVIRERPRPMRVPDALDTDSTDFRLIEMIQTYPELYDSNADNHGDVNHTDILWEIIGKELNYKAKDAKEKFKILRGKFELENRASEKDASFRSKWPFFERMKFLASAFLPTQSKNLHICRFCAKENVEMLATACTPDSTIAQLFESVINIDLIFSSAFPTNVCAICVAQLQIVDEIQKRFRHIDERWREQGNYQKDGEDPLANVLDEDPEANSVIKVEFIESKDNNSDFVQMDYLEDEETKPSLNSIVTKTEPVVKEPTTPYYCYVCERSFLEWRGIIQHRVHSHQDPGPFICDFCNIKFTKKKDIEAHMANHTEYRCIYCAKLFPNSYRLHFHENRMHRYKPEDMVNCEICHKVLRSKYTLWTHMRCVHANVKEHACPVCGTVFSTLYRMQIHLYNHNRKRDKVCPHCPKTFRSQHELSNHIRKHTNERPYCCDVCAKAFKSLNCLKLHIGRKHAPNSQVKKKIMRDRHHFDYGQFKCDLCGCGYKSHQSLRNHFHTAHPYVEDAEWLKVSQRICFTCNRIFDSIEETQKHQCK